MEMTFRDEHVNAVAESVKGEVTSVSLLGLLIVTPATAGSVTEVASVTAVESTRMIFIGYPLQLKAFWGTDSPIAFVHEGGLVQFWG